MAASVLLWGAFLRREARAPEPILDPKVLLNRTFLTASLSAFMSFFGLLAVTAYFPLFLQGVQGEGAVVSGQVITPYSVLVAFMGVPAGLLLSRTRRYRWMYILGYGVLTLAMFGLAAFLTQRRTKEIGIRKVMGATASQLTAKMSAEFLRLVVLACALACPLAYWISRKILGMYAYRAPVGASLFGLGMLAMLALAALTVGLQTMRAARANPVDSLRYE